jgi:hypothetical protein
MAAAGTKDTSREVALVEKKNKASRSNVADENQREKKKRERRGRTEEKGGKEKEEEDDGDKSSPSDPPTVEEDNLTRKWSEKNYVFWSFSLFEQERVKLFS